MGIHGRQVRHLQHCTKEEAVLLQDMALLGIWEELILMARQALGLEAVTVMTASKKLASQLIQFRYTGIFIFRSKKCFCLTTADI